MDLGSVKILKKKNASSYKTKNEPSLKYSDYLSKYESPSDEKNKKYKYSDFQKPKKFSFMSIDLDNEVPQKSKRTSIPVECCTLGKRDLSNLAYETTDSSKLRKIDSALLFQKAGVIKPKKQMNYRRKSYIHINSIVSVKDYSKMNMKKTNTIVSKKIKNSIFNTFITNKDSNVIKTISDTDSYINEKKFKINSNLQNSMNSILPDIPNDKLKIPDSKHNNTIDHKKTKFGSLDYSLILQKKTLNLSTPFTNYIKNHNFKRKVIETKRELATSKHLKLDISTEKNSGFLKIAHSQAKSQMTISVDKLYFSKLIDDNNEQIVRIKHLL